MGAKNERVGSRISWACAVMFAVVGCGGDDTTGAATSAGSAGSTSSSASSSASSSSSSSSGGAAGHGGNGGAAGSTGGSRDASSEGGSAGTATGGGAPDAPSSNDAASEGDASGPVYGPICNAIATTCGVPIGMCNSMFAPIATCEHLLACLACAGSSPMISCEGGNNIHIVGCESACTQIMDSCAGDGGQGDGNRPGDAHPSDANRGDAVAEVATSCLGAPIVAQSGTDNTPNDPQVVASGAQPVAIFGPPDGMGGYREPSGFFRVTGYPPNAPMLVQIIMAPCSTTNCAPDISFALGAADAGNVTIVGSTNQSCGSKVVSTDTSGSISISVGKSGDAGQEGGIGIVISPVPPDSGGPADATSD